MKNSSVFVLEGLAPKVNLSYDYYRADKTFNYLNIAKTELKHHEHDSPEELKSMVYEEYPQLEALGKGLVRRRRGRKI